VAASAGDGTAVEVESPMDDWMGGLGSEDSLAPAAPSSTELFAAAGQASLASAPAAGSGVDRWETLGLMPFLGVSAGGGLATDGTYLYAADFSGDGDYDYLDLNANYVRDPGESLAEMGFPNGSVRMARYDPAEDRWDMMPTLNAGGVGGDAFSAGDLANPLFVAGDKLYYYQFRAGPNTRALYSYDLAAGLTGSWTAVWEKTDADNPLITANAGLVGVDADGQAVIFHHIGGGEYDFARTDTIASGGVHARLTPQWDFTGAHFPRNGSWEYDAAHDRLYHMSGDQLLYWEYNPLYAPGGNLLTAMPPPFPSPVPIVVETVAISSLRTATGWWTSSAAQHPGMSLWGNSLTLVDEPSGVANGPAGQDTGDDVLYLVRGESSPDEWPFNEGRGTPYTQFARYFAATGEVQTLPETPFAVGKGSCAVYLDGCLYVTQGDTLTVADDPGNVEPMNREGIRLPGRGLARFVISAPDTAGPQVTAVTPTGTVGELLDHVDVTFSEPVALSDTADPDAFDPTDVQLTGPSGSIAVSAITVLSGSTYRVAFPAQGTNGNYTLTILPTLADRSGNPMDQDGDGIEGEPADGFSAGFDLLVPLSDLKVSAATAPAQAQAGQTITVSWTVQNLATRAATADWLDYVYFSTSAQWSADAVYLGLEPIAGQTPLAANGSYTITRTVALPTLSPGSGYLLFVANADHAEEEADRANNCMARPLAIVSGTAGAVPAAQGQLAGEVVSTQGGTTVAVADFDGDGISDLVIPAFYPSRLEVRLGLGQGTWGAPRYQDLAFSVTAMAAADFDRDGRADLAAVGEGKAYLLRSLGGGVFGAPIVVAENLYPTDMRAGSLDAIEGPDLALYNSGSGQVTILLGDGSGGFKAPLTATTAGTGGMTIERRADGAAQAIAVADQGGHAVSILRVSPEGTLERTSVSLPSWAPYGVGYGDLTGDGVSDLAVGDASRAVLGVVVVSAGGEATLLASYRVNTLFSHVAMADLDGDADLDVVATSGRDTVSTLWLNRGDGGLVVAAATGNLVVNGDFDTPDIEGEATTYSAAPDGFGWSTPDGAYYPIELVNSRWAGASGTENPDGFDQTLHLPGPSGVRQALETVPGQLYELSLAVSRHPSGALARGRVLIQGAKDFFEDFSHSVAGVSASDMKFQTLRWVFRADSAQTVVRLSGDSRNGGYGLVVDAVRVRALGGAGDGASAPDQTCNLVQPSVVLLEDVTGDGRPDLVAGGSDAPVILINRGDGSFLAPTVYRVGTAPMDVAIGDLDGVGGLDLVVPLSESNQLAVLLSGPGLAHRAAAYYAVGSLPRSVAVGDLNNDGISDLVVANQNSHNLGVLLGLGGGRFAAQVTYATDNNPFAVLVADLNGDRRLDVAVTSLASGNVNLLMGQGDGTLAPRTTVASGAGPQAIELADMNGDGVSDLVVANTSGNDLSILTGQGDGTFAKSAAVALSGATAPCSIALRDFNEDGGRDIAVLLTNRVRILLNQGGGAFSTGVEMAIAFKDIGAQLGAGDFNGDGHADVVTGDAGFLRLFAGDGQGGLLRGPLVTVKNARAVAVADVDGDGGPDVVTTNWALGWGYSYVGDTLSVVWNRHRSQHSPVGAVTGPVRFIDVRFRESIDPSSFSLAEDVIRFEGPLGSLDVTAAHWLDTRTLRLQFDPVSAPGDYALTLGPQMLTPAGEPLDMDQDGRAGEVVADRYVAGFTLAAPRYSGTISADSTWSGAAIIDGSVTVAAGVTLTIAPGTIVKFGDANSELVVDGRIEALGTTAEPVVFTSIRDDANGGDTNGDGTATLPAAGDWTHIRIRTGGVALLDHADLRYGGGDPTGTWTSLSGMVQVGAGGRAVIVHSALREAFYDGVLAWEGGLVQALDTLITGADRGVVSDGASSVTLVNCTLDDNRIGVLGHRGSLRIESTIISNSLQVGVDNLLSSPLVVRFSNVWSTQGLNYDHTSDRTGQDGNVSVDPGYRDLDRGLYQLEYLSPMIDAGDTAVAPPCDAMGAPRYDDPRTANTGIPDAGGAVADIGAFEFVETAPSPVDLVVALVIGPSQAVAGQTVTIEWTVTNQGTASVVGSWHDALYLLPEVAVAGAAALGGGLDDSATRGFLIGEHLGSGDFALVPGASRVERMTVRVPGVVAGTYRWQVLANARSDVFEGANQFNNSGASAAVEVIVPAVILGGPAVAGEFTAERLEAWFRLDLDAGERAVVRVEIAGGNATALLQVAKGRVPTPADDDGRNRLTGEGIGVGIEAGLPGTWYLRVSSLRVPTAPTAFSVTVVAAAFSIQSATPDRIGNAAGATVTLSGEGLPESAAATLRVGGIEYAGWYARVSMTEALVTFDLEGATPGAGTLEIQCPDGTLGQVPLTVEAAVGPLFSASLKLPAAVRAGRWFSFEIEYVNAGDADMPIPLLIVESDGLTFGLERSRPDGVGSLSFLAPSSVGEAGVLRAGQRERIQVFAMAPTTSGTMTVRLSSRIANPESPLGEALDWDALEAQYRPAFATDADAWSMVWRVFSRFMGRTWDDVLSRFASEVTDESRTGSPELRFEERMQAVLRKALGSGGGLLDVEPPGIISQQLLGPATGGFQAIELVFSESIDPASFTAADVTIVDPAGRAITGVAVHRLSPVLYRVDVPLQTAHGEYAVSLGPAVTDQNGLAMDGDGDGVAGEAEDGYQTVLVLSGEWGGAVAAAGATDRTNVSLSGSGEAEVPVDQPLRILSYTLIGEPQDYGSTLQLTFSSPVTLDTRAGGIAVRNDTTGALELYSWRWWTKVEGSTALMTDIRGTGSLTLTIEPATFKSGSGQPLAAPYSLSFAVGDFGPAILRATPGAAETPGFVDSLVLEFDSRVDWETLTTADVSIRRPDGSVIPAGEIRITHEVDTRLTAWKTFEEVGWRATVFFPRQTMAGVYSYTIGPEVSGGGTAMQPVPPVYRFEEAGPPGAYASTFTVAAAAGAVVSGRFTIAEDLPMARALWGTGVHVLAQLWRQNGERDWSGASILDKPDELVGETLTDDDGAYTISATLAGAPLPALEGATFYVRARFEHRYAVVLSLARLFLFSTAPSEAELNLLKQRGFWSMEEGLGSDLDSAELAECLGNLPVDEEDIGSVWLAVCPVIDASVPAGPGTAQFTFDVQVSDPLRGEVRTVATPVELAMLPEMLHALGAFTSRMHGASPAQVFAIDTIGVVNGLVLVGPGGSFFDSTWMFKEMTMLADCYARSLFYNGVFIGGDHQPEVEHPFVSLGVPEQSITGAVVESHVRDALAAGWGMFFAAVALQPASQILSGPDGLAYDRLRTGEWLEANDFWMGADAYGLSQALRDLPYPFTKVPDAKLPVDELRSRFTGVNLDGATGDYVAGAVASILWDLADPANDDGYQADLTRIWNSIQAASRVTGAGAGLEAFYKDFVGGLSAAEKRAVDAIFIDHGAPVTDDGYDAGGGNDTRETAADLGALDGVLSLDGLVMAENYTRPQDLGAADWYQVTVASVPGKEQEYALTVEVQFEERYGDLDVLVEEASISSLTQAGATRGGGNATATLTGLKSSQAYTFRVAVFGHGAMVLKGASVEKHGGDMNPSYRLTLTAALPSPTTAEHGCIVPGGAILAGGPPGQDPADDWGPMCPIEEEDSEEVNSVSSQDPNDKVGPVGFGTAGAVAADGVLPFVIHFENDPKHATAPAQEVVITDPLDSDLDWTSFELGAIQFGDTVVAVPPGRSQFAAEIALPESDLVVRLEAGLDPVTGVVTWRFTTIDNRIGDLPEDPFAGFLPVNDATHRGEGSVSFAVRAKAGLADGTEVLNQAIIVFDVNAPLPTNITRNTIDAAAPSSQVTALPAQTGTASFLVAWDGEDTAGGSGIAGYDVYAAEDDGAYRLWLAGVESTSAVFAGRTGHRYRFFSVAHDQAGWVEAAPAAADAETTVTAPTGVVGRWTFYNGSAWDGMDAAPGAADDAAIATDKQALRPEQNARFVHYTSYSRGINGIMVDIADVPGTPGLTDFVFRVGNTNDTVSWTIAPAPGSISVRLGAGVDGSDRVTLIWADATILNQWLQVTVRASAATGLTRDDVFYFGNAVGETGDSASDALVTAADEQRARQNPRTLLNPATVVDVYDFNRDRKVNATDQILARNHGTDGTTALVLLGAPAGGAVDPGAVRDRVAMAASTQHEGPPAETVGGRVGLGCPLLELLTRHGACSGCWEAPANDSPSGFARWSSTPQGADDGPAHTRSDPGGRRAMLSVL